MYTYGAHYDAHACDQTNQTPLAELWSSHAGNRSLAVPSAHHGRLALVGPPSGSGFPPSQTTSQASSSPSTAALWSSPLPDHATRRVQSCHRHRSLLSFPAQADR
nr:unnamed protein product [Digitaria exilis]